MALSRTFTCLKAIKTQSAHLTTMFQKSLSQAREHSLLTRFLLIIWFDHLIDHDGN